MEQDDPALRPSQPPDEAGKLLWLIARQVDATTAQSTALQRVTGVLERLERRLAVQPSAPLFDPRTLVVRAILVAGVAALVGAVTALAWSAAASGPQLPQEHVPGRREHQPEPHGGLELDGASGLRERLDLLVRVPRCQVGVVVRDGRRAPRGVGGERYALARQLAGGSALLRSEGVELLQVVPLHADVDRASRAVAGRGALARQRGALAALAEPGAGHSARRHAAVAGPNLGAMAAACVAAERALHDGVEYAALLGATLRGIDCRPCGGVGRLESVDRVHVISLVHVPSPSAASPLTPRLCHGNETRARSIWRGPADFSGSVS